MRTFKNDIAILKLIEPINLGPNVQMICLPKYKEKKLDYPLKDTIAYIMGWGRKNETSRGTENFLLNAKVNILDTNLCNYTNFIIKNISNTHNFTRNDSRLNLINMDMYRVIINETDYEHFLSIIEVSYILEELYQNNYLSESQICAGKFFYCLF